MSELVGAACKGTSEPLWDAQVHGESEYQREVRHVQAKAICATCPIRDECLAQGLIRREEGVWGGRLMQSVKHGPPTTNPQPVLTAEQRRERRGLMRTEPQACDVCGETVQRKNIPRHRQRWHAVAAAS